MRPIHFACACLASALLLEACSGGSSALPTTSIASIPTATQPTTTGLAGPDTCPASKIYVADYVRADVEIYPQGIPNPTPCGKIRTGISFPEALAVDAKGKLYVANYGTSSVSIYPRGKKTPTLTITTAAPGFDLFVGKDKTLYVAEPTIQAVEEFAPGATTPFLTLSINGGPHGVATDSRNRLYVTYLSNTDGVSHVEKFAPKASTGTDLGFTIGFSGEIKLDALNDIIIGDRNSSFVYIYPPGKTEPSRGFPTAGKPVNFALNNDESLFYVSGFSAVQVVDYATGGQVDSISTGLTSPSGVALYPPAPY